MNLSKTKIAVFFLAILILGWFLYPRELFLAFMYEGRDELGQAETYYLSYLHKHPLDRFATVRLSQIYNRMALPEKATSLLEALYDHRPKDWEVANSYLNHLEEMNDLDKLYKARRKVAQNFMNSVHFPTERIVFLLESSLQYALWNQKYEEAYSIIDELMKIEGKKIDYIEYKDKLDRGLKKMDEVLATLLERLQKKPKSILIRRDIVSVYIALKRFDEALAMADESLKLAPDNIYLLQSRVFINTKLDRKPEVIRDIKHLIALPNLKPSDRKSFTADLGYLYKSMGDTQNALAVFEQLLKEDAANPQNWLNVLGVHADAKNWDKTIALLKNYLEKFPDDETQRQFLVDVYLFIKKDPSQLDLYREHLHRTHKPELALDVAYLLNQSDRKSESETWLLESLRLFPGNVKILDALLGIYLEQKNYAKAEPLLENFLKSNPDDPDIILDLAQIKALRGDHKEAAKLYKKLGFLKKDAPTLKLVGKELFFMGLADDSGNYIAEAQDLTPDDPELWFWRSEIAYYKGERVESVALAKKAVAGFESQPKLSADQKRMLLKARARIDFTPAVQSEYRSAIRQSPRDADLQSDFIDMQLENKRIWDAQMEIKRFKQRFPEEEDRARPYELRLAFLQNDFKRAISLLHGILSENPAQWSYRRDLADAYVQDGEWEKSIAEYEEVRKATGDKLKIESRLNELHDEYDHQVSLGYRFVSLEAEDYMEWIAGGSTYLSRDWKLSPEARFGRFDSSSLATIDTTVQVQALISNRSVRHWTFTGGAGFGASPERKTVYPVLGVNFQPLENLRLSLDASARKLRMDFPQAVVQGDLQDQVEVSAEYRLLERVIAGAEYEFTRDYLPGDQKSYGHRIEPSLSFVILKDPYLSLGYLYSFADQSDENGFLTLVNLIPRMQAHYITAYVSKDFKNRVKLEANAFIGEDTERDLHLFEGDLFGFGAKAKWRATKKLNVDLSYDFGRETLSGIGGESHQFGITLTGHWF